MFILLSMRHREFSYSNNQDCFTKLFIATEGLGTGRVGNSKTLKEPNAPETPDEEYVRERHI